MNEELPRGHTNLRRRLGAAALACAVGGAPGRPARAETPAGDLPPPAAVTASAAAPRTYRTAVFTEAAAAFIPYANDLVMMVGVGLRLAEIHELWARVGYIPIGDDTGYGVGSGGYRVAFRPRRIVRPLLGVLLAGESATCDHNMYGRPTCSPTPLFIFSGTVGVRLEPVPWLGIATTLAAGTDSYPHPFGMLELAVSFALPQHEPHDAGRGKLL
jgi:hypothetical protein